MRGARVRDSRFRFPTTVRMFGNGNRNHGAASLGRKGVTLVRAMGAALGDEGREGVRDGDGAHFDAGAKSFERKGCGRSGKGGFNAVYSCGWHDRRVGASWVVNAEGEAVATRDQMKYEAFR